ncbi:FHA domain-containing protein [Gallaecimonas sp. GXIMD4217]|uniref:FHA domain-containing protein n=1 Tax=Gallaecimonas sp. GXIMD4217 TaxID=3131927 RepID=UPI00311B0DA5
MPARLSLYFPQQPVKVFLLDEQASYTLGRDPHCQICIEDGSVSRQHARFLGAGRGWTLEDLGSKNATTVNGEAITRAHIDGDRWLTFGQLNARFQILGQQQLQEQQGREAARWQACARYGRQLNGEPDLQRLLAQVLEAMVGLADTDRAFILLKEPGGELAIRAVLGVSPQALLSPDFVGSRSAVNLVLEGGEALVTSDSQAHGYLGQQPSVQLKAIRALACLPLDYGDERLGVIYTDSLAEGKAITELDLAILEAMANNAAMAIVAAMLRADLEALSGRSARAPLPSVLAWSRH